MGVSSLKNKVKRLEESMGPKDEFSEFLGKYLEILGRQPTFLPCEEKNIKRDYSEFDQLRLDFPEGAKKFDEWIREIEQGS